MSIQAFSVLDMGLVHKIVDMTGKEGCHLLEAGPEVARKLVGVTVRASLDLPIILNSLKTS